ncbi:unnamed protein product, partial [Penicillium nalgiovense]
LLMVFALLALYSFTMSFLFVQSLEPLLVPWAILSQVRLWGLLLANSFLAWIPFFFSFFFFFILSTYRVTGSGIRHVAGSFDP